MDDIKDIIAKNIADLRRRKGLTQTELAQALQYSDKAVSKWERGESLPDVRVLKALADTFGVTLDYLVAAEHDDPLLERRRQTTRKSNNRRFITGMSLVLVWLVAALVYVVLELSLTTDVPLWITFLCAIPTTMIVWLVLNASWFNTRWNYLIISLLLWTTLGTICVCFYVFGNQQTWILLWLGVPAQVIILLWSRLKFNRSPKAKKEKKK